jgi:anthranilate phosphoribosyltransferase
MDACFELPKDRLQGNDLQALAREIAAGRVDKERIILLLRGLAAKGLDSEDIRILAQAFREATVPVHTCHSTVLDLCGTGGGSPRTFNISTAASFLAAGAGVAVAKHGNRSNAGLSGSADVMEALGVRLKLDARSAGAVLDAIGITFLFAPSFNPAMRHAAAARKEVGGKTVFNVLGPLLNPVVAERRQLIGVYEPRLLELLPPVLDDLGTKRALLAHGHPDLDEVSTLGPTQIALVKNGSVDRFVIHPQEFDLPLAKESDLRDRSAMSSAILIRQILYGIENGPARQVVLLNSACALVAAGRCADVDQGLRLAEHAIDNGRAAKRMERLIDLSRRDWSTGVS